MDPGNILQGKCAAEGGLQETLKKAGVDRTSLFSSIGSPSAGSSAGRGRHLPAAPGTAQSPAWARLIAG